LVIFDFDGTLADTIPWLMELMPEICRRFNLNEISRETVQALRSDPSPELVRKVGIPLWKLPLIAWHIRQRSKANAASLTLFPGMVGLISKLHARGAKVGIVSSNDEEAIARVLGPELAAKVSYYECRASIFGKSHRLARVLKRAGVKASEAIYIGDETRDAEAARAVGMDFGAVGWGYSTQVAFSQMGVTAFYSCVEELEAALLE